VKPTKIKVWLIIRVLIQYDKVLNSSVLLNWVISIFIYWTDWFQFFIYRTDWFQYFIYWNDWLQFLYTELTDFNFLYHLISQILLKHKAAFCDLSQEEW